MELLPPQKRVAQVLGLVTMLAGFLLFVGFGTGFLVFGRNESAAQVVLRFVIAAFWLLAVWGGKRLLSWGMRPSAETPPER